jgi:hypothetical protein
MTERQKCFRAHVNFDCRGATAWAHYGYLSPCGEWVEVGDTRHRRTAEWFDTEDAAKAAKADEVMAMAARLEDQAVALRGGAA